MVKDMVQTKVLIKKFGALHNASPIGYPNRCEADTVLCCLTFTPKIKRVKERKHYISFHASSTNASEGIIDLVGHRA